MVNDGRNLTRVLATALRQRGFNVKTAFSGSEAIYLYSREDFDLLITDSDIMDMDAVQLISTTRKLNPCRRFIVVSTHPSNHESWQRKQLPIGPQEEMLGYGEVKCLPRTFELEQLFKLIAAFSGGKGAGRKRLHARALG